METIRKKIKLVTFAPHPNFGTCLQSYALNMVLRKMGHDVEFIYNGRDVPARGVYGSFKDFLKYILPKTLVESIRRQKKQHAKVARPSIEIAGTQHVAPEIITLPNSRFRYLLSKTPFYDHIYRFLKCRTLQWKKVYAFTFEDGNFQMKRLYTLQQYEETEKDADLFVTGSDQIWNPYCGGFNPMMFLEFVKTKKCIAYSSSVARACFPPEVEERAKRDLQRFSHIAVREETTVPMLKRLLERDDIRAVVDPTYLLTRGEWQMFGERAKIEFKLPERYIFCYFIGFRRADYMAMVEDVKKKTGITDVITIDCVNCDVNYGGGLVYKNGGPYEFVYLLSHASFVCMDSFHATVFALKFNVDFAHILKTKEDNDQTSQNTRMYDLLRRYNLLYKIYSEESEEWLKPVEWTQVEGMMDNEIASSMQYLKNAIME